MSLSKNQDSESSKAVGDIVRRIELFLQGEPFTLVLDDITGNSFIENPYLFAVLLVFGYF